MPRKPPVGRRFKKGQSGNPLGGKLHNPAIRAIKRLTNDEIADIGSMLLAGDVKTLEKIARSKKETPLRAMIAAVSVKAINSKDSYALDTILNRVAGKVPSSVNLANPDGSFQRALGMTPEERAVAIAALQRRTGKKG